LEPWGGNHYIDLFSDEAGALWLVCISAAAGWGTTASGFLNLSLGRGWEEKTQERKCCWIGRGTGARYFEAMGRAAVRLCREGMVCRAVARCWGEDRRNRAQPHNFAWREKHFGRDWS
jgi:hypothetical protein